MSKVYIGDYGLHKEKLIHSLRRKEAALKKQERIKGCKNKIYGYRGYYTSEGYYTGKYISTTVPEKILSYDSFAGYIWQKTWDPDLMAVIETRVPIFHKKTLIVPEHIEIKHRRRDKWIETTTRLKKADYSIKGTRKRANKKIRLQSQNIEALIGYKNGEYKKVFDVQWLS